MDMCTLRHVFSHIYIGSIFGMRQLNDGFEYVQVATYRI
jgi:hypothetical protein